MSSFKGINSFDLLDGDEEVENIDVLVSRVVMKAEKEAKLAAENELKENKKKPFFDNEAKSSSDHGNPNKNGVERFNGHRNGHGQNNGRDIVSRQSNGRGNGSGQPNGRGNGSGQPSDRGSNFRSNNVYKLENGQNGSRQGNGKAAYGNDRSNGQPPYPRRADNVANGNASQRRRGYGERRVVNGDQPNGREVKNVEGRDGWEVAGYRSRNQRYRSLSISSAEESKEKHNNVEVVAGEGDAATTTLESKKSEPEKIEKVLSREEIAELKEKEARWKIWLQDQKKMTFEEYEKKLRTKDEENERKKKEATESNMTLEEYEAREQKQEEERLRRIFEAVERSKKRFDAVVKDDKNDQVKPTVGIKTGDRSRGERFSNERNRDRSNSGRGEGNKQPLKKAEAKPRPVPVPPSVTDLNHFPALGPTIIKKVSA